MNGPRAHNFIDMTGRQFGRWTVLGLCPTSKPRRVRWLVKCNCGKGPFSIQGTTMRRGQSLACRYHRRKADPRPGTACRKLFNSYVKTAKKRGLEWGLTFEQFKCLTSAPCYYTGRAPAMIVKARGNEIYKYNGIDRLDNSKGYILGNIVSCCRDANYAKLELSESDFYKLILEIVHQRDLK